MGSPTYQPVQDVNSESRMAWLNKQLCETTATDRPKDVHIFIFSFKTILVSEWILQSYDGVLVSQENSQSCHPIWQESRFANFTHLSSQLFSHSFSKFLPMFLFPPFPLSVFYTETASGSPPAKCLGCRWCLCRIGVWSATFDLYKRLCPRREDLKLVESSVKNLPLLLMTEIRRSPVEAWYISHSQGLYIPGGVSDFSPLTLSSTPPKFAEKW